MNESTLNYEMSIYSSADASEWAKLFCKVISENKDIKIDEEFMTGWFSNAMMAMHNAIEDDNIPKYY